MSQLGNFGSAQANNWAQQRKEAMEKAKQLREEKKNSSAKTGEMIMNNRQYPEKGMSNQTQKTATRNTGATENYGYQQKTQETRGGLSNTYNFSNNQQRTTTGGIKEVSSNTYMQQGRMEQDYSKQKPLGGTMQRSNQPAPNSSQGYRQQPSYNNVEYGNQARGNEQTKLRTVPQQNTRESNYDNYSNYNGNRTTQNVSQSKPSYPTQNTTQSRVTKPTGNAYQRDEYVDSYERDQFSNQRGGKGRQDQNRLDYEYDSMASLEQQYLPKQQQPKVYNPLNYGAKPSGNMYDQPINNNRGTQQQQAMKPNPVSQPKNVSRGNTQKETSNYSYGTNTQNYEDERGIRGAGQKKPMEFDMRTEKPSGAEELEECPAGCGRSFFPDVLLKHAKVCQKVFQSKRKQFDMTAQRMTDEQLNVATKKKAPSRLGQTMQQAKKPAQNAPVGGASKAAKWKQESEAFRASMKVARGETLSKSEQVAMASHQQDSLIPCDYCGRRFNEKAAERHIPFCQSKQKNVALKKAPLTKTRKF